MNKKADIVRVYLPPDANTLLSVTDRCLGTEIRDWTWGAKEAGAV